MIEFDVATAVLNELVVQLNDSLAGPVSLATVHPGDTVPAYSTCAFAAVRVAAITPAAGGQDACGPTSWDLVLDLVVNRCYPPGADPSRTPDMQALLELSRAALSDAAAMRRALCAIPDDHRWTAGVWSPVGPLGVVYGGIMPVTVHGLDLFCC